MYLLPSLLYVILFYSKFTVALWPFNEGRISRNSLINAGSLGLDSAHRLVAFGDFDGDQSLDILALDSGQRTITVYIWNNEKSVFQPSTSLRHSERVKNIVPGDYNNDGRLDLLVMSNSAEGENTIYVYFSDLVGGFEQLERAVQVPSSTNVQPFLVDSNGDMKIDLLGVSPTNNKLVLWKNVWNETEHRNQIFNLTEPLFQGNAPCVISDPHSNAFIDLDGDCLADIFLTCQKPNSQQRSFQIWVNSAEHDSFVLRMSGQFPNGAGPVTFADMDRDGTIDMVFPTCKSIDPRLGIGHHCSLNIVYNKQRPLCKPSLSGQDCRTPGDLCTKDSNFQFDFSENNDNDGFVRIDLGQAFGFDSLLINDVTYDPPLPVTARVGDLTLDGYPDIIVIGVSASGNSSPYVLNSIPCSRNTTGCDSRGKGRRGFRIVTTGTEIVRHINDARGVAVMDLDEDGTLDILVQRTGTQGEGTIAFIRNNFFYDAFFLKAMVMNRPCDGGLCRMPNGSTYEAYGMSYSGATYKYTVQDTFGERTAAQIAQLPQTSYHSLHTPYSFFGLGRTNNYIENLFVGSTKRQDTFINMEGVIPNSKVIIIPSLPGQTSGWKRELFLRPGAWIPWVTLTLVVSTVILAIIVFVLHLNEKREDELERRRASHHINFDAL